jgi:hypothetical protein
MMSEALTRNKRIEKELEAKEMWFWRIMFKGQRTDKITNEDILKQINEKSRITVQLKKR